MSAVVCSGPGGRGCPCPYHVRQRGYARASYRRLSAKALDVKRMRARTCPRKFSATAVCGAVLESVIVDGRLVVVCRSCERYERGICGKCPRPVAGTPRKARWCAEHRHEMLLSARRRWRVEHREEVNAHRRTLYEQNPRHRERSAAYNKLWRNRHPDRAKQQARRKALKQSADRLAYMRRYHAEHRDDILAWKRAKSRGVAPLRTCCVPDCDIVVTGRKKKCSRCKQRDAQRAVAA